MSFNTSYGMWKIVKAGGRTNGFKLADQMKVFPVPSDGQITIQIENPVNHGELGICNSVGTRTLSTTKISKQFNTVLPRGIYFVKYTDYQTEVISRKKIIVE